MGSVWQRLLSRLTFRLLLRSLLVVLFSSTLRSRVLMVVISASTGCGRVMGLICMTVVATSTVLSLAPFSRRLGMILWSSSSMTIRVTSGSWRVMVLSSRLLPCRPLFLFRFSPLFRATYLMLVLVLLLLLLFYLLVLLSPHMSLYLF